MSDQPELAPVVPLRSDDEERVAIESAVLDDLEERDAELDADGFPITDPRPARLWPARHTTPEDPPPRP